MQDWLEKVLSEPTASVQDAGKVLGISKNKAYELVKTGELRTVSDRIKRVPTEWLRRKLEIDGADR